MSNFFNPSSQHESSGMGLVANINGMPSHRIVKQSIAALGRMSHGNGQMQGHNADGAGLLLALPQKFFMQQWPLLKRRNQVWAVGQLFLPLNANVRAQVLNIVRESLELCGLHLLDGREVPKDVTILRYEMRLTMPHMSQILICPANSQHELSISGEVWERKLFLARRVMEKAVTDFLRIHKHDTRQFYVLSLSAKSIVYKALIPGEKLADFYIDLQRHAFETNYAIFHQRLCNTKMPSWRTVQPLRMLAHSGELPCLKSLIHYFEICKPVLKSSIFGNDLEKLLPIMLDSHAVGLDNLCEFLTRCGRPMPQVLMMLFPEYMEKNSENYEAYYDFYKFNAALFPPLGGLSQIIFNDNNGCIGAMQNIKSRHTSRYSISENGIFILASEAGVLDLESRQIKHKGRVRPGQMIMLDLHEGRIVYNAEIKGNILHAQQYKELVKQYLTELSDMHIDASSSHHHPPPRPLRLSLAKLQARFGHSHDDYKNEIENRQYKKPRPMPIFDRHGVLFFDYFSIVRTSFLNSSKLGMSTDEDRNLLINADYELPLKTFLGKVQNPLEPKAEYCKTLFLQNPIILPTQLQSILSSQEAHICTHRIAACFKVEPKLNLERALEDLQSQAEQAIKDGATILILSHRSIDNDTQNALVPIPSLLAIGAVHTHLQKCGMRHLCGIISENGDAISPLHMATLINAGADAICPYVTLQSMQELNVHANVHDYYVQYLRNGLVFIFNALGVDSVLTLRDGQYFEAVGISESLIKKYFNNIISRVGGIGLEQIASEAQERSHSKVQVQESKNHNYAQAFYNKLLLQLLDKALSTNSFRHFQTYLAHYYKTTQPHSLRCLLQLKDGNSAQQNVNVDMGVSSLSSEIMGTVHKDFGLTGMVQVEPAEDILKRFVAVPMQKLSSKAKHCLNVGYAHVGSQTCYGHKTLQAHIHELHLKREGIDIKYINDAEEILISMIHNTHNDNFGHHDMHVQSDVEQLIYDLRKAHPYVRISVKIPARAGIGHVGVGLVKAGAHCLWVVGCADIPIHSPLYEHPTHILPLEMGLSELQHSLTVNKLRRCVRLRVLGQFFSGRDILKAILLGAEEFSLPTASLLSLGCELCHICESAPCPKGLHANGKLEAYQSKAKHMSRFLTFLTADLRREMANLGFSYVDQLVGRADLLEFIAPEEHFKGSELNLEHLTQSSFACLGECRGTPSYAPLPLTALEQALLEKIAPLTHKKNISRSYCGTVNSMDRSVGTHISGQLLRYYQELEGRGQKNYKKEKKIPRLDYSIKLWGSAGQSLGAFLTSGIVLNVYGEANDHVGKGLSGGTISISHAPNSPLEHGAHALIGNVALYGALAGELYVAGLAGEYFAVCNHGALAVVEGVGDYACQHMHGGTVVVLGPCGKNFAQGMCGGTAFIYDPQDDFKIKNDFNEQYVQQEYEDDLRTLRYLLQQHMHFTKSNIALSALKDLEKSMEKFIIIKA